MKNITLSVDDKVLTDVRRYAAQRDTTVNALVRDFLTRIATQEDRAANARQRLLELAESSEGRMGEWRWSREATYDRSVLSGHERPDLRGGRKDGRS
jgi:hypothetical protein